MAFDLNFLPDDIDDSFDPGKQPNKVEALSDGKYDFKIDHATLKINDSKGMLILELALTVESAGKHMGATVNHALFISDKDSAARVGKDLVALGFDCDQWTKANNRPFSQEIQKVEKVLRGLRFEGTKKTNESKTKGEVKTYHNLYINKRILTDGKPERLGPAELNAADPQDPFSLPE